MDEYTDRPRKTRRHEEPERESKRRKLTEPSDSEEEMEYWGDESRSNHPSSELLSALQSHEDFRVVHVLKQLAAEFSLLQEDMLGRYPVPQIVPLLVKLLGHSAHSEVQMYAVNCIVNMLDVMSSLSRLFVTAKLIPVLGQKLAVFEFIDVAEGAVKALEKLATDHASLIVQEGLMTTLANLLGFFDIEVQKNVMTLLSHCAQAVASPVQYHAFVEPALPLLLPLLQGDLADKLLSFFCTLLDSLAEGCGRDPGQVKSYAESLSASMLKYLWELLNAQPRLSPKVFEVLTQLAAASCEVSAAVHNLGVVLNLKASLSFEVASKEELEYLGSAFKLLRSLLPESPEVSQTDSEKRSLYARQPQLVVSIAQAVVPRVLQQFDCLVGRDLKHIALQNFLRVLTLLAAEPLTELVNPLELAGLVQELLYSSDLICVRYALSIVVLAYEKAPSLFSPSFLREGVIARIANWTTPKLEQTRSTEYQFDTSSRPDGQTYQITRAHDHRHHRRLTELRRNSSLSVRSRMHRVPYSRSNITADLAALSKRALKMHSRVGAESTSKTCDELARLAVALGQKFYSSEAVLKWVMAFIEASDGVTSYELFTSGFAEALWRWLSQGLENLRLLQVVCTSSLQIFDRDTTFDAQPRCFCHTGNFEHLLQLLVSSLRYSETFKAYNPYPGQNKAIVNLVYLEKSSLETSIAYKRKVFRVADAFSLTLDFNSNLESLEADLLKINSAEDLEYLMSSNNSRQRRSHTDHITIQSYSALLNYDREARPRDNGFREPSRATPHDITVEFSIDGKVLPKHIALSQLISEEAELQFQFVKKTPGSSVFLTHKAYYTYLLQDAKQIDLDASEPIVNVLRLLKLFYATNQAYDLGLSVHAFQSTKLTSLITQILNEFSGLGCRGLPHWANYIATSCHFLLPFSLRNRMMKLSANPEAPTGSRARSRSGSFSRHKVTVKRGEILEAARRALCSSAFLRHTVFEYEYIGEEGTGQGPTLEFYYLLSQAIRGLPVWRQGDTLFPAPAISPDIETFTFIGRVVGKALADERLLDLPLSPLFWKLVFCQPVAAEDLRFIDMNLARQLQSLPDLDPAQIEELMLDFTLPGLDALELKPNGRNIAVTFATVDEYCELVRRASLMQVAQASAFRQGLEELIDLDKYRKFDWNEIEDLVCGSGFDKWDFSTLSEALVPAHGYSSQSTTYVNLLTVLSQFPQEERRLFLTFVTGSPRLPIGGFKGLVPPLTVVKKEAGDDCLPSVMTCQNYLKLPDYSDIHSLMRALSYAIYEGRENFHFS